MVVFGNICICTFNIWCVCSLYNFSLSFYLHFHDNNREALKKNAGIGHELCNMYSIYVQYGNLFSKRYMESITMRKVFVTVACYWQWQVANNCKCSMFLKCILLILNALDKYSWSHNTNPKQQMQLYDTIIYISPTSLSARDIISSSW